MAKLWRRPKDGEDKKLHVHEVDLPNVRIDKPSLIFLNGFFTTDARPEWVAASLRYVEDLLAERPGGKKPVEVYAWSHSGLKDFFNVAAYGLHPGGRASAPARKLAAGLILPLVAKDFRQAPDGTVSGTPLPADEAKKNMRNLTFFGYSAGCVTAQECFNAALELMKKTGYAEKDARAVLQEAVYIGVGSMSRPGREKDRFTSLTLEAVNDRVVRFKNRFAAPLRAIFGHFSPGLKIKPLSDTSAVISAAVTKTDWETRVRDGKTVRQKINALLPRWLLLNSYHEMPRYVTEDEALSPFAKIVQYALLNATARDRRLSPAELIQPPPGLDAGTAAAYREKIAKAHIRPRRK